MLPRLRFVVASLLIAVLPMVFLGAGLAPTAHTSPAELSRADKPIVLSPAEYSETQYRQDRIALSYARRETELSKLRVLASAPLSNWIVAPAGAEPDNTGTVTTITTSGPAVVAVNTTNPTPEKTEVTVSITTDPADKRPSEVTVQVPAQTPAPENDKPAAAATQTDKPAASKTEAAPANTSMSDAPHATAAPIPSRQVFAALNPGKAETSTLPQVHVVMTHPKPRARIVRRPKPVPTPPVVQQPPPFFELFAWLFNLKPQPAPTQAQTATTLRQQPQVRSSITPATPFRTAAQP